MDEIQYIDIDLDQIDIWKDELDSLEYCQETFGELGYILYEYYQNYDISIFEKYKKISKMKKNYEYIIKNTVKKKKNKQINK
jgi:hypothetical protein